MDKELAQSIGSAARQSRKELKLTQEEAAELIGVSSEFYARIERGNALPSVMTLSRICVSLNTSADVLLGRYSDDPDDDDPPTQWTTGPPSDPPEIRRLLRRLRSSTPSTLRLVTLLIKELDRYE